MPPALRSLKGVYGKPVALAGNGQTVMADEQYIRESILRSQSARSWPDTSRSCRSIRDESARTIC